MVGGGSGPGAHSPKKAIATKRFGLPATMQVITRIDCTRQGPFLFIAPDIGSHDEEFDGGFTQHTCIDTLEPVIKPAYLQAGKITLQFDKGGRRSITKIYFNDMVTITGVRPRSNEQLALANFRRTTLLAHDLKI